MATLTLRGLVLVGLGACDEGKRLFLQWSGRRKVELLGDRELDIITCATTLTLPPKGQSWTQRDWTQRWFQLASTGYLGWLISNQIAVFDLPQDVLIELLKDSDWNVRRAAAQALSAHALGPAVQVALSTLKVE